MDIDVTVTDEGLLAVRVDAQHWPPLPVEAVEALVARVPDARAAWERRALTTSVRHLTSVLVGSGPEMSATVHVAPDSLIAEVDDESFGRVQEAFGVEPGVDGELTAGLVTVRRRPAPPRPLSG